MYCKNCGTKSNSGQKFCTGCDNIFSNAVEPEIKQNVEHFPKKQKKVSWDIGRIIGIIILLCLIGVGAYNSQDDDVVKKNNQALTSFDSGNKDQAISGFQDASKNAVTTENKINTLKNLGYVYAGDTRVGQKNLAIETFKQALALTSSDSFDYYLIAGEIAILEDKPNSAIIAYNKAYKKTPNDFQINNALALFYLDIENNASDYIDYKKAVQYGERTVQLTDLQFAKENLGIAYYYNKDYDKAISTFLSLSTNKPSSAYFVGLSYVAKKDTVNAKYYLNKAIDGGQVVPQSVTDYINSN